jgi:hypothetical protein
MKYFFLKTIFAKWKRIAGRKKPTSLHTQKSLLKKFALNQTRDDEKMKLHWTHAVLLAKIKQREDQIAKARLNS